MVETGGHSLKWKKKDAKNEEKNKTDSSFDSWWKIQLPVHFEFAGLITIKQFVLNVKSKRWSVTIETKKSLLPMICYSTV